MPINIDNEWLKKWYLFANSARQLYSTFRENPSLQSLAKIAKAENLVEEYKKCTEKPNRSLEDVVNAYAIIVASTFYKYEEAQSTLRKLDLSKLEWGEELLEIYKREARIIDYVTTHGTGKEIKEIFGRTEASVEYVVKHGKGILDNSDIVKSSTQSKIS